MENFSITDSGQQVLISLFLISVYAAWRWYVMAKFFAKGKIKFALLGMVSTLAIFIGILAILYIIDGIVLGNTHNNSASHNIIMIVSVFSLSLFSCYGLRLFLRKRYEFENKDEISQIGTKEQE